jgi:probable HAF family extracellular repeat protein
MRTLFAAALGLLTCAALSCGGDDGLTGPTTGQLQVTLSMTGEELDPDGCQVSVDGGSPEVITAGSSVRFTGLEAGSHSVRLDDLASNCTVEGPNPRSVSVAAGTTTPVTFSVTCSATTGSIEVLLTMTGEYLDTDGGQVSVDGGDSRLLESESLVTFTSLAPGTHTVLLEDVAVNCTIEGQNPRTVEVEAGHAAQTTFSVTCTACGIEWSSYVATYLGSLGGSSSLAYGINDHKQIVGWASTSSGDSHAFLWEDGAMIDLGTLGGEHSTARAINNLGQVVGHSGTLSNEEHAFLWEDGVMIDLGTLGGTQSFAFGINDNGQIVGAARRSSGDAHAFLWEKGAMTDLGTLGGDNSWAWDINNRGQVVGTADPRSGLEQAFLWEDGGMINLGTSAASRGCGINDLGNVVGYGDSTSHAFIWKDGEITQLPGLYGSPSSINDRRQVVGSYIPGGEPHEDPSYAVLWEGGELYELGGAFSRASDINRCGAIVGFSNSSPSLWTPRP